MRPHLTPSSLLLLSVLLLPSPGCFPLRPVATEAELMNSPGGPVAMGLQAEILFLFDELRTPPEMELVLDPGLRQVSGLSGDSDWEPYEDTGISSNDVSGWGLVADAPGVFGWALHLGGADAPADVEGQVSFQGAIGWRLDTSGWRLDGGLEEHDALHFVADYFVARGPRLQLVNAAGEPLQGEGRAEILEHGTVFFDDSDDAHFENGGIEFISNEIPTTQGAGRVRLETGQELETPEVTAHRTDDLDSTWSLELVQDVDGLEIFAHLDGPDGVIAYAPGTAGPVHVRTNSGGGVDNLQAPDAAELPVDEGCGFTVELDPAGERWTFDYCLGDLCVAGEAFGYAVLPDCDPDAFEDDGLEGTCIDISTGSREPKPLLLLLGVMLSLMALRRRLMPRI